MRWSGGYVRADTGCLPPLFGKETRIWVHSLKSQLNQPSKRASPERLLPTLAKFTGQPYIFQGVPSDPWVMERACWEEWARRPEAVVSPWPHPQLLLAMRGLIPSDGEEPGAHVRIRCAALVSRTHGVTSAATCKSNPPIGKQFEIGWTGEQLPKSMKIILFHA